MQGLCQLEKKWNLTLMRRFTTLKMVEISIFFDRRLFGQIGEQKNYLYWI